MKKQKPREPCGARGFWNAAKLLELFDGEEDNQTTHRSPYPASKFCTSSHEMPPKVPPRPAFCPWHLQHRS
jgi:hypothetical protein